MSGRRPCDEYCWREGFPGAVAELEVSYYLDPPEFVKLRFDWLHLYFLFGSKPLPKGILQSSSTPTVAASTIALFWDGCHFFRKAIKQESTLFLLFSPRGFVTVLFCEVCGREIIGKPARSLVEGATLVVCKHCASLGKELPGFPERPQPARAAPAAIGPGRHSVRPPVESLPKSVEESDLVDDYPRVIKEAREKLGLSQQELGFKTKEKMTVIQKIELGKMLPTMRLTRELEHILRVKLLVPKEEIEVPTPSPSLTSTHEATLGDVALVRQKNQETK